MLRLEPVHPRLHKEQLCVPCRLIVCREARCFCLAQELHRVVRTPPEFQSPVYKVMLVKQ
jgi:hypothetical protein